jgi:glycosyltransferase involved in cell wall biosynthesis
VRTASCPHSPLSTQPTVIRTAFVSQTPKSLRLLLATDSYPPLIGGATRAAELLATELCDRGHDVTVVTAWQRDAPAVEERRGVTVHRVKGLTLRMPWLSDDPFRQTPPPFPDPEMTWRIRRLIKRLKPDLVHSYGWLTYSCAAALLGADVPLLISTRDYSNTCALRTLVRDEEVCSGPGVGKCLACAGRFYGQPKGVVAVAGVLGGRSLIRSRLAGVHSVSHYVQDHTRRFLLGPGATQVVEAVLPDFAPDHDATLPDPKILAALPDSPFILFVGALRRIKGLQPLLSAHALLRGAPPLVLIGTKAPDTPEIPASVTVLHNVPHATVLAAWDRALFGVAPSILPEPLGNVIHEAMGRGRPVIGTRPGGHGEMIEDGENGLLVPAGDVGALADAMQLLLDDRELRERLGNAARSIAPRFTAEAVMPGFEKLYQQVASAGAPLMSKTGSP